MIIKNIFISIFFFFKQKTAYEIKECDWSSDVCSSDLYKWRVQGLVRSLRDPQFLYNRFVITMADILESQVNSGWIFKEDSVINPDDLYLTGQGRNIGLKRTAALTDLQKIPPGEISQSYMALAQLLDRKSTRLNSSHIPLSRMPSSA